jgi:hypothetical protein
MSSPRHPSTELLLVRPLLYLTVRAQPCMPQLVCPEHGTRSWLMQLPDESFKFWLELELQREDMKARE